MRGDSEGRAAGGEPPPEDAEARGEQALSGGQPPDGITVVLADDHALVRAGLRVLLQAQPGLTVIGEAEDVRSALTAVERRRPTVLVLDLGMPGEDPLASIPALRAAAPDTAIVVLTMDAEPRHASSALEAGAVAYVLKEAVETRLVEAIRAAAAGKRFIDPELGGAIVGIPAGELGEGELSERDLELLRMVALGHTSREIADKLFLSVRTIEVERGRLQRKLGLSSRPELVKFAIAHGAAQGLRAAAGRVAGRVRSVRPLAVPQAG